MLFLIYFLFLGKFSVIKLFVGVFSKGRRNIKRIYNLLALLALMVAEYGIVAVFKDILFIKILFIILAASISMCVFYKDRWRRTLILTVLFYGVGFVADYLVIVLMGKIFSSGFSMNPITSMIMSIISRIVLLFTILMIKRITGHESANTLSDIEWMKLLIVPIITMASIIAIVQKYNLLADWHQDQIFFYLAIGMAVMNIDVFYLVEDILQREQKIREAQLYKEQVKNETAWYYSISANLEKQRQRTHEYKNHLACISALVQSREYNNLDEYLHKLDDEISQGMAALKKRCGGLHANTFLQCLICTTITYTVFVKFLLGIMLGNMKSTAILFFFSFLVVETIGAINHPNMNWKRREFTKSKEIARMTAFIETLIIMLLLWLKADRMIIVFLMFAMMLSAFLLVLAKIFRDEVPL